MSDAAEPVRPAAERAPLALGYTPVEAGRLATVVTFLEMRERPVDEGHDAPPGVSVERIALIDLAAYRRLFRAVGEPWLWTSRLMMSDDELAAILHDRLVEVHVLSDAAGPVGLLELDFRSEPDCEIAYFGVGARAIGRGVGRFLMAQAIERAWSRPIDRLWVHTCHLDHPSALGFYRRAGFRPYATMVEVMEDPRATGLLPREAAPQVPLLD